MPQKGDYTHLVNFLGLSSLANTRLSSFRVPHQGFGLLRKTAVAGVMSGSRAENACCCSYCWKSTENGDLAWTAKAQL